jgi:Cof subfamily protein (haloacid dehalogenase superfamily)
LLIKNSSKIPIIVAYRDFLMYMTEKDFNPSTIQAIAFDLDGTVLGPGAALSDRTLRALQSCIKRGIQLIIATGRALDSGEKYRKRIGMTGPQVYYNGAEVADTSAGKLIHTQFIDSRQVLFCVRLARHMGLYYQVYFPAGSVDGPRRDGSGEILMADRITAEAEAYRAASGVEIAAGDLEEHLARVPAVIKGMFITAEKNHQKLRAALGEQYGDSIYIVRSSPYFLETLAAGVSKGNGLLHALKYLDIQPEHTLAFGDEENDLPLFKTAGFSAAPANAKEALRNAAMFQIPANTEDGVAAFLEAQFGLN